MITITADDIRVLAQSTDEDPVLVVVGGDVQVVPQAAASGGQIVYTKAELLAEHGEEITDVEAVLLAGGLSGRIA